MTDAKSEEFEKMTDLALENARLINWCERNGREIEDTSAECTALLNQTGLGTYFWV